MFRYSLGTYSISEGTIPTNDLITIADGGREGGGWGGAARNHTLYSQTVAQGHMFRFRHHQHLPPFNIKLISI